MDVFNWGTGLLITGCTAIVFYFVSRKENPQTKLLFGFMILTTLIYSGIGIAYEDVSDRYIISYLLFLCSLCLTVKLLFRIRFRLGNKASNSIENDDKYDFDYNSRIVLIFTVLFMVTNGLHLIVPTFNLQKLFSPGMPTSELIYARKVETNSNIILKLASTINVFCMPFFFIFLKKLIDKKKKTSAVLLVLLWMYLEYLQYNYLGRYQIIIYLAFSFCIGAFVYPDGFKLKKKYMIFALVSIVLLTPFLDAYKYIRLGRSFELLNIRQALQSVVEAEISYPQGYDTCASIYGSESVLTFILWLICLPIPSVLFPGKPAVTIAYSFTYAVTGLRYGAQAYYSSKLPSLLGEGMILWGPWLVGFHGVVIGIFIGLYFKFIKKHESLIILYLYMILRILTIGRGGASSYMSVLINGTISLMVWNFIRRNGIRRQSLRDVY